MSVFVRDGDLYVPTPHAIGPWDAHALHGGGPAGLLARAAEALDAPVPMRLVRLTIEFLRAVPHAPLDVRAEVVRGGKRLQLVEGSVLAEGAEVLRARAVRLRIGDVEVPDTGGGGPAPGPAEAEPSDWHDEGTGFARTAMEIRFARGGFNEPGPALAWLRLRMPLVEGESPSPAQRAVAAADFGNGVSAVLDWSTHVFINTDLTVSLHRDPEGEWIGLDARTDLDPTGAGQATTVVRDERGTVGHGAQSLYVDRA